MPELLQPDPPAALSEDGPFLALRSTWQPVINSANLPLGGVRGATLLGERLALVRFPDGNLLAARAACPHKGFDLSRSSICDGKLQCAYHGWRFNHAGDCLDIPSLVNPPVNKLVLSHMQNFAVQERYGIVWVSLDEPAAALPEVPEFEDPAWTYVVAPAMRFRAGFRREVENYLDMTHFAFAHGTTLGVASRPVVPAMDITELADGFLMDAPFPAVESPLQTPGKLQQKHRRRQRCHLPNFTTIRQTFEDGDERVLLHVPSPILREECNVFWALAISPNFQGPAPEDQIEFATRVLTEDREMCENQWPAEVPINPAKGGWGVLVTPGDTLANTFQKTFRRWLQKRVGAAKPPSPPVSSRRNKFTSVNPPSRIPSPMPSSPEILTTTVGSYSPIDWLAALPSEQAVLDATAVVINTQRRAGIDLPTDGELYRFDVNHPDTNGMIEYFISRIGGISTGVGLSDARAFRAKQEMSFRRKPAGVVRGPLTEGVLDLREDCARSASVADGDFKFTLTSPYMLARTLLDNHYGDFEKLTMAIADVLAAQVADLPCACVQVDEANVPGSPEGAPIAQAAINRILDAVKVKKAVHFCFGNYGGQTIQKGGWKPLLDFLNGLHADHLVLELAHRPASDLDALADIDPAIQLGIGVIDIKVNHVETPDEVAARIDRAVAKAGPGRVGWVHPDCGFWMLKRSVADRKIEVLVKGRDRFLGR